MKTRRSYLWLRWGIRTLTGAQPRDQQQLVVLRPRRAFASAAAEKVSWRSPRTYS